MRPEGTLCAHVLFAENKMSEYNSVQASGAGGKVERSVPELKSESVLATLWGRRIILIWWMIGQVGLAWSLLPSTPQPPSTTQGLT